VSASRASTALAAGGFEVTVLSRADELAECDALYREVFTTSASDTAVNPRLLFAIARHGGIVVGARAAGVLIGFAFSFLARDGAGQPPYQYSQTAAVTERWRGRGVGRALKLAQREAALRAGIELIRWRYDPMHAANAHFNLDVLGAIAVALERDAYGSHGPPADGGEPTDRLLVDWRLTSPRVVRCAEQRTGEPPGPPSPPLRPGQLRRAGAEAHLAIPAQWRSLSAVPERHRIRDRATGEMAELFADGFVATSCARQDAQTAVYRFQRSADADGGSR